MKRQIAIVALVVGVVGCSEKKTDYGEKESVMAQRTIEQVQEAHTDEWMNIPGVEGTAIGLFEEKPCIKIFSSVSAKALRDKIPSSVEGYPVVIEQTGGFRALD